MMNEILIKKKKNTATTHGHKNCTLYRSRVVSIKLPKEDKIKCAL